MKLEWLACAPAPVQGLTAEGEPARRLAARLMDRDCSALRGVHAAQRLVLLGPALPWAEGVVYLGRQESLLFPTLVRPNLPLDWIVAALRKTGTGPWLLLPDSVPLSLHMSSRVDRSSLERFSG
jgi:hypothetical protein